MVILTYRGTAEAPTEARSSRFQRAGSGGRFGDDFWRLLDLRIVLFIQRSLDLRKVPAAQADA
jgi:hypothetical protein